MKKQMINFKKIPLLLGIILLFFFSSLFQLIPIYLLNINTNSITTSQNLWLIIFSDFVLLTILILVFRKSLIKDFKKIKGNLYSILDSGIKYWLIGLIVMIVSNIIIGLFITQAHAGNEESVQEIIHSSALSIIAIGILSPIIEELTFRKTFREVFKNKILFVLTSGLIFGGLHVVLSLSSYWDLFYIIPYSSLGIAFGYMYQKTDNIYTSIIMHIFHNTVLTTFSLMGGAMILL